MNSSARRNKILAVLTAAGEPVSASKLAAQLHVSRQIIVGDVALLRASGAEIDAIPKGYIIRKPDVTQARRSRIVCLHTAAQTEKELNIMVDNGCRVLDVIVEHPVYGQFTGMLDISSRYDVKNFIIKCRAAAAHSLFELTDGIHIHTVEYTDESAFTRTLSELSEAGILYSEQD